MAANFDIVILTNRFQSLQDILECIHPYGFDVKVQSVQIMEDWDSNNLDEYKDFVEWPIINKAILDGKKSVAYLRLNNWDCGVTSFKINDSMFENSCWFSLKDCNWLDSDSIDKTNRDVYDLITEKIIKSVPNETIILIALGVETYLNIEERINETIEKSHNVVRWVVKHNLGLIQGFKESFYNGFYIYDKISN